MRPARARTTMPGIHGFKMVGYIMIKNLSYRFVAALGAGLLLCVALVAGTGSGAAASVHPRAVGSQDWPMFLQNTSRTAATTDRGLSLAKAPDLALKWAYQT